MADIARSRMVAADVAEVWAELADFGSIAGWAPNVDHSCLMSDQKEGVGAVRRIQAGRTTLVERVTEWEAPTTLAYSIEGLPPALRSVISHWTIESVPGGCNVTLASQIDAGPRPPQQLVARAAGRRLASAADEMLTGLERQVMTTTDRALPIDHYRSRGKAGER